MSDYIERDKIMNFCNAVINRQGNEEEMNVVVESFKAFAEYVKVLPSAQPEREKGTWTNDASCPFCGFQPWYEHDIHTLSFCPNCGSDMRNNKNVK